MAFFYGVLGYIAPERFFSIVIFCNYFPCFLFLFRPLYGSFVRPHKLLLGCDEITALKDCYGDGSFDEEGNRIILHKQTKQETFIEMVGFDKIAKKQRYDQCTGQCSFSIRSETIKKPLVIVFLFKGYRKGTLARGGPIQV